MNFFYFVKGFQKLISNFSQVIQKFYRKELSPAKISRAENFGKIRGQVFLCFSILITVSGYSFLFSNMFFACQSHQQHWRIMLFISPILLLQAFSSWYTLFQFLNFVINIHIKESSIFEKLLRGHRT